MVTEVAVRHGWLSQTAYLRSIVLKEFSVLGIPTGDVVDRTSSNLRDRGREGKGSDEGSVHCREGAKERLVKREG